MRSIARRVQALEGGSSNLPAWKDPNWKPWKRIIQREGQTQEEAVAAYEAENGPLGEDDCFIIRVIMPEPIHD